MVTDRFWQEENKAPCHSGDSELIYLGMLSLTS